MIEKATIREKYNELFALYSDKHIDDYDTFVRSRVVEHFFNNSQETADNIVNWVEYALSSRDDAVSLDESQKENDENSHNAKVDSSIEKTDTDSSEECIEKGEED